MLSKSGSAWDEVYSKGRGLLSVLYRIGPVDGGHRGVSLEVTRRQEARDVSHEVVLMFDLTRRAINGDSIKHHVLLL